MRVGIAYSTPSHKSKSDSVTVQDMKHSLFGENLENEMKLVNRLRQKLEKQISLAVGEACKACSRQQIKHAKLCFYFYS